MRIGKRTIGEGPPFIVAEISANHCGSLEKAIELINAAAWIGADAVKFQHYTPDTITLDCDSDDFILKEGPWKGRRLYELYTAAHTPPGWFPSLFGAAVEAGIPAFASVFDRSSVDALEKLDCPAYKIASMEIVDTPLIRYAAATGKPLIISTGMASDDEILQADHACEDNMDVAFLHCVSGYPTNTEESNLYRLYHLRDKAPVVGLSDHTCGTEVAMAATAMGANIIEKHLCLSRSDPTEDAAFSLEPHEFQRMIEGVKRIWFATQPVPAISEQFSRPLRRSLYVTQDMVRGDMFTAENVRSIRPGYGLPPSHINSVIGNRANDDIKRGTALTQKLIK